MKEKNKICHEFWTLIAQIKMIRGKTNHFIFAVLIFEVFMFSFLLRI